MSPTPLLETPTLRRAGARDGQVKTCRFAGECSCVFNRVEPVKVDVGRVDDGAAPRELEFAAAPEPAHAATPSAPSPAVVAQYTELIQRGWKVTSADTRHIVLQRRRRIPFCVNVLLCAVTLGLWGVQMAWRARHPKIETTTLALTPAPAPAPAGA